MFKKRTCTYVALLCLCVALLPYNALASSSISNYSQDKSYFYQSNHSDDEMLINEDIFIQYIDEASKELQLSNPNNLVLFLGPTCAGKSTTICSLLFGKLDKIKKFLNFEGLRIPAGYDVDIKVAKGKSHPKIGHSETDSCTVFPACYPLTEHNLGLCDFPGFFDSGGIEKRTVKSITSKQFLAQAKHIKAIVFVMAKSDLEPCWGHTVTQVIEGLTKMLANPLDHVNSIFFALTKSDYNAVEFRYIINEFAERIKKIKANAITSNRKSLYDLLDTMLTKHQENFLVVNPLEEKSSKMTIARLKQSKGFPANAIKLIGDDGIYRASFQFFTKCAKEGIEILDICNTYPKKIRDKTKEAAALELAIIKLSQAIDHHHRNDKEQKKWKDLFKVLQADIKKAEDELATLKAEKAAKEKYIRNHDTSTLVPVGHKHVSKEEMKPINPWFQYKYRIINIAVSPDNGSYCKVSLDFDQKNGYIVKKNRLRNTYKATYRCYEDGGSGLTVTLLERSRIRCSREISKARERVKKLTATEIPDKKNAIAVLKRKASLMEEFLAMSKSPTNFDLVKELEARKTRLKKDLGLLQSKLNEMQKELLHAEKELCRKRKLFDITASTDRLLGFTYGPIANFAKEYRLRGRLLTSGYIRRYTKGFPKELFNIVLRTLDFI